MSTNEQVLELLNGQIGGLVMGTAFLMFGFIAANLAILRRRSGFRILLWLSIWSGAYGATLLCAPPSIISAYFPSLQTCVYTIDVVLSYLMMVFALFVWLELVRGQLRSFLKIMIGVGSVIALAGIGWFLVTGSADNFWLSNNLCAAGTLLVLITVVSVKRLADRFLLLANRGIVMAGTFVFATQALYDNLARFFHYPTYRILGSLGFAALLYALALVAAQSIFTNERRLFSIEIELETARQIQASILPAGVPEMSGLRLAAAYHPMTAVAGDFYDIIRLDEHQAGFLVADVSGHGVPAALIASMIKIAMQSVVSSARDPGEVLRRIGEILGGQLRGQLVSAAYLFVDLETCRARYSAAGHPPLAYWDAAARQVLFVESNGLLFGVRKELEYPVREWTFQRGDRFLLYTDGLVEAENAAGEAFGEHRFSEIIRSHEQHPAGELSARLFDELRSWQTEPLSPQDDITWIIVDIVPPGMCPRCPVDKPQL
jgi:sigma-B regulation protein RsbU (phosphoserine phosphatase)